MFAKLVEFCLPEKKKIHFDFCYVHDKKVINFAHSRSVANVRKIALNYHLSKKEQKK